MNLEQRKKELEVESYQYMEEFRKEVQNNHLHPWVAAQIGYLAGRTKFEARLMSLEHQLRLERDTKEKWRQSHIEQALEHGKLDTLCSKLLQRVLIADKAMREILSKVDDDGLGGYVLDTLREALEKMDEVK